MNPFNLPVSTELTEAIGWTIVHSLWQGIVVTVVLSFILVALKRNSAQVKYLISFFALLLVFGWSIHTFVRSYEYAQEKTALRESMRSNPEYVQEYLSASIANQSESTELQQSSINLNMVEMRSFFQRHFNAVLIFWVLGVLFFVLRIVSGFIYARRLRTRHLIDLDEKWIQKIEIFAERLQIRRKVTAFFSPLANTPMTLGTLKPIILFPVAAFTGLSVKDVEAILAHELAHVVRHDYFFNIVQSVVEIIFFYHPAVWIISKQIRNERENSCDNMAIELTGDKVAYVKALAKVQINEMEQGQLAMTFASQKGNLLSRIKRLQKKVAMKTNFIEGLIAAAIVVVGLTLVSFTMGGSMHSQVLPAGEEELEMQTLSYQTENVLEPRVVEIDSLRKTVKVKVEEKEELGQISKEVERMVEVALSETDEELSAEMLEEINEALEELDLGEIIEEAMEAVEEAMEEIDMEEIMKEAREDIDYDEIRRDMEEARKDIEEARREVREEMRTEMEREHIDEEIIKISIQAAEAGLNAAEAVIENLPLDEIIDAALQGVGTALKSLEEIDFDEVMKSVEKELEDDITEEELEELKKQLEEQKKILEQKEKELKRKK